MASFSPRTPADEAWRKQLHTAFTNAKVAQQPMRVKYFDGRTQTEVVATVVSAHAVYDDFVVRMDDGVSFTTTVNSALDKTAQQQHSLSSRSCMACLPLPQSSPLGV